jgi:hypothetical protein
MADTETEGRGSRGIEVSIPKRFVVVILLLLLVGAVALGSFITFYGHHPTITDVLGVALILILAGGTPACFLHWYLHRNKDELEYDFDEDDDE